MPDTPCRYELSVQADRDLADIYDFTASEFGKQQATGYLLKLDHCFNGLLQNPQSGRARPEIRKGLSSIPCGFHVVFYRILKDRIRIVRVLHASRDLPHLL
ncbi:type II toxin-antitoxin system RelE/ParE family toxin [Alcanivorax sp. S6407]|uniref:type II toxin-antitoxin system RelE/ParE family toxin n=1 Tax=Alcanivorax sp. S6407 TaxID=2926424 RepID=UPI001FF19C23|nr:type II toxin-antitoxin system RelE/ParE family toxin [Alcanivorax sp. S6407]MCK0153798.1 type II toxin-antitoxin system RelE/ParE family toxin [Alcanivorax sp. S6407]